MNKIVSQIKNDFNQISDLKIKSYKPTLTKKFPHTIFDKIRQKYHIPPYANNTYKKLFHKKITAPKKEP